jgi:hypothetical protein
MADKITDLPDSGTAAAPTRNDIRVMQALFGESLFTYELKRLVVPTAAFVVLSLPFVDAMILKMMPSAGTGLALMIKAAAFALILVAAQLLGVA